jgi:hypothetical protein
LENETHAFIIRIWIEAGGCENVAPVWRGSIDHVGANQRLYFSDLDGVNRFIQEQIGVKSRSPLPWFHIVIRHIRNGLHAWRRIRER